MHGFQQKTKVTVEANDNIDVPLVHRSVLEKLTIWAVSGERSVRDLSFQVRINGVDFGAAVAFAGPAKLAEPIFRAGDGAADALLIPVSGVIPALDPLSFVVNIASTFGTDQEVTLYFAARANPGGPA